jgi:hypothetical protein
MPESVSGAACATAVAASCGFMLVFNPRNKAPPPETNGALNEVPHPAAYVP